MPLDPAALHLRARPDYELVEYSRLSEDDRASLASLRTDPTFYGILRSTASKGSVKSVCWQTALLWQHLQQPGPAPDYLVRTSTRDELDSSLRGLIADGVLEYWDGEEWRDEFPPPTDEYPVILEPLTRSALRHGAMLVRAGETEPVTLSTRLYSFHREPISNRARLGLSTPARILSAFGLEDVGDHWRVSQPSATDPWIRWHANRGPNAARCKVYLSPTLAHLESAIRCAVPAAESVGAVGMKIAGTGRSIGRPDRFIVYFRDRAQLDGFLALLDPLPTEITGHGVPFTANLDGDRRVISWGADPSAGSLLPWLGGSWRRHLTDLIASAMLRADPRAPVTDIVASTTARIAERGIDPSTWEPQGV